MTGTIAATLWTLITVTYGGNIGHSHGYTTKNLCEEAKSVSLTGLSIEDKAIQDAKDKAAALAEQKEEAEAAAQWRAEHPCYAPRTKEERATVKGGGGWNLGPPWTVESGKICPENMFAITINSAMSVTTGPRDSDIKYAECVIEQ